MNIVHGDRIFQVNPDQSPDYNTNNPLVRLMRLIEKNELAADQENYFVEHTQYLFPYDFLELYGPDGNDFLILDPRNQDNKLDFQKQNIKDFRTTPTTLARGWATVNNWTGPFLKLSYSAGPETPLAQASNSSLGDNIRAWIKVGNRETNGLISIPYNPKTDQYEIEIWGYPNGDLRNQLDEKGQAAFDAGLIIAAPDLILGTLEDFKRIDDTDMRTIAPQNSMHPILPLTVQVAWTNQNASAWDSKNGQNYQYQFNMIVRGWENYLGIGVSANPHGGIGFLHYRNLMSNYFYQEDRIPRELGRQIEDWNFNADGNKNSPGKVENYMSVDYMDLHILKANCGIGLHRHRDNQEVFFMVNGYGMMVVGDWCQMPERERCFEVRPLRSGHMAMLKGGNLHGLMNVTDEDCSLFMFGGYD
jgi:mannose-6-phosphate isomerase-like protein (cupin superfamily)